MRYEKPFFSFQAGKIGQLMTLAHLEVTAGDTISIDIDGAIRLSPLRRNLTLDSVCTVSAFYRPHRHSYNEQWTDFIKDGVDEQVTFTGIPIAAGQVASYLGGPYRNAAARWLVEAYNAIWNRYYMHPTFEDEDALPISSALTTDAQNTWGMPCAWLPTIWNVAIKGNVDEADLTVPIVDNKLDLTALQQQKARLQTERAREFFIRRYNDVMKSVWGTRVNIDADKRPKMLYRNDYWLSGYDVDGTSQGTLGQYSGKSSTRIRCSIPRRRYSEHGVIMVMALVRFPTIHHSEVSYLTKKVDPSYKEIAGDDTILANEPPINVDINDYMAEGSFPATTGLSPYGSWYRYHPSHIHKLYDQVEGFPFVYGNLAGTEWRYIGASRYDHVFQTDQLGHWQTQLRFDVTDMSDVPVPEASIFAGSR